MVIGELAVAVWPRLATMRGFLVVVSDWPGLSLYLQQLLGR